MTDLDKLDVLAAEVSQAIPCLAPTEAEDNCEPHMALRGIVAAARKAYNATVVATYWRDAFMDLDGPLRAGAHPLAMVLAALDGETEPAQLGIEDDAPAAAALNREAEA